MAELGVAGSAVGIISLGIQVCQGLIQYYESWKDAPKDVTQMCTSVSNLEETLKVLRVTIQGKGVATRAETGVQNNIDACTVSINELQGELIRVQEIKGSSIWSKVHGQGRRLLYPFRESTLLKLKGIVAEIRENLSLTVEILHLQETANSREQLDHTSIQVNDMVAFIRSHHNDQESRAIVDWMSPLNFFAAQNDTLRRRQDGTAEWIFETFEFEAWLAGIDRILWCSGLPGAGKTILASAIIDKLQKQLSPQNVGLAFIYFNYGEQNTQTLANLIGSLDQQLVQCYSIIPDEVRELYAKHNAERTQPSGEEFLRIFQLLVSKFSSVYVVVDALDECNLEIRCKFIEILQNLPANLHLLCTSRHLGDIQEAFADASRLEIRARDADIARYVEAQILQVPRLTKFCKKAGDLQGSIIEKLAEKANGMFLLARLHLESLKTKTDIRSLRQALDVLPEKRDKTYREAIERIQSQHEDESKLAMRALSWITHAIRPLRVEEIQHAIAVMNLDPGDTTLDEEGLIDEVDLITVCGGLAVIDQDSRVIRLVHYTTQEYFNRTRGKWFPNAESEIATTCVTYLSFDVFDSGSCHTDDDFKERVRLNKFFAYAVRNWGHHARMAPTSDLALHQAVAEFLRSGAKVDASSQGLFALRYQFPDIQFIPKLQGLHLAAYFGVEMVMELLLKSGTVNADLEDSDGRQPISWGAENGHTAIVQLLLNKGANIEAKDIDDIDDTYIQTPLSRAAENGHEAIVQLLLNKGANIEARDIDNMDDLYSQTPLSRAAENGHTAIVQLLLNKGANIEAKDMDDTDDTYIKTPLSWAAKNGHKAIVQLLLNKGANIEAREDNDDNDRHGRTPLSWAAKNGHEAIVQLLLNKGADIEARDHEIYSETPLSRAAQNGHEAIVQLLLDKGANFDTQDSIYGLLPLSSAAKHGDEAMVQLLLNKGTNIEARDNNEDDDRHGRTPLLWAAENGYEAIVQLLLDKGADFEAKFGSGQTAIWRAALNGHKAIVQLLLEKCAKLNATYNVYGQTPLSWAVKDGQMGMVKLLLETGKVDVDSQDEDGQTPLASAASNGHEEVVNLLLDMGKARADAKCGDNRTPLSFAAEQGHEVIVNLLLEKGVEVDSKDIDGLTPLLYTLMGGHQRIASLLIREQIGNVNCANEDGQTLLYFAAKNGFINIVERLLEYDDIDVDKEDKFGTTPLSCAAENGCLNIFTQLVKKGANVDALQSRHLDLLPTGT